MEILAIFNTNGSFELTWRSCLAASAPARVLNVTKPTGYKKERLEIGLDSIILVYNNVHLQYLTEEVLPFLLVTSSKDPSYPWNDWSGKISY